MNGSLLLAAFSSMFVFNLANNIQGPLFPEILNAYHLTDQVGAIMFALNCAGSTLGALLSRSWLRRFSRIATLQHSIFGSVLGFVVMGVAPTFWILVFGATMVGFFGGMMSVIQNTLGAIASRPERRTQVLGGLHAMYGIASFLSPLLVTVVVLWSGTWRAPFFVAAVPLIGLLIWSWQHFKKADHVAPVAKSVGFFQVSRQTVWLGVAIAGYGLAEAVMTSRLSLFMRRVQGQDLTVANSYVTGFFICMLLTRLAMIARPFHGPVRGPICFLLFGAGALFAIGLIGDPRLLMVSGLLMGPTYPLMVNFLRQEFGEHLDGIIGWVLTVQGAFTVAMHLSVGWLTDATGLRMAMMIGPGAFLVSFLLIGSYGAVFHRHPAGV